MDFFWAKIVKKMEFKGQKLTFIKKKSDISGQKNKLELSLRTKKGHFWKKIVFRFVKNLSEIAKIKQNKSNNGPRKG